MVRKNDRPVSEHPSYQQSGETGAVQKFSNQIFYVVPKHRVPGQTRFTGRVRHRANAKMSPPRHARLRGVYG